MMIMMRHQRTMGLLGVMLLVTVLGLAGAAAQSAEPALPAAAPLHPQFALLDVDGANVLDSGEPVSTLKTCGTCHDTAFIQSHSYHATLGLDRFGEQDAAAGGRTWDASPGAFGQWDALRYRHLSTSAGQALDLGTAEWVMTFGDRHIGGGPALYARDGSPLTGLPAVPSSPETAVLDPQTGQAVAWDWAASGVVEMNCFLCHLPNPNNDARINTLKAGAFGWANTATLAGTGLVEAAGSNEYAYSAAAFDAEGLLKPQFVTVQDPTDDNCGQCHGLVHTDAETPVALAGAGSMPWTTYATGQIISGQQIDKSGMNVAGKEQLSRPWDIHAARQVQCVDCHYSLNNPVHVQVNAETSPDHLVYDPRRLDLGEYLLQPVHDFAKGSAAQHAIAPELADTMRRCEGCHDAEATHGWLPYTERHLETVACESCHIPKLYAPALRSIDWTVLTPDREPRREYRGVAGDPLQPASLIEGFQPALLINTDSNGRSLIAPHNLVTAWYWVYGDPLRPVRLYDLESVWFDGDGYAAEVVAALDGDGDGILAERELVLDTAAKQAAIAARLATRGVPDAQIIGDVQPYSIAHNVTDSAGAIRDCTACHSSDSILAQPVTLAAGGPSGVTPALLAGRSFSVDADLDTTPDGVLQLNAPPDRQGLYVFGQSRVSLIDWFGVLAFLGTLAGVALHGGLRFAASMRMPRHTPQLKQIYVYTVYERFWHWLQTFTIVGLIFTGLIIHKPEIFGMFAFRWMVYVHNVLAAIVVINAALSLFYHLTNGEVRQFIPRPRGFYDQAILQAKYYLGGIFKNEPHPFEKDPARKLNPLQQVTYLGLLNVLLPAQIVTGALIWGAQHWPEAAQRVGGLPLLAPLHSLVAWLLAAFVVMHVYLATTGHTPTALIEAMITGWEEVEVHPAQAAPATAGLPPAQALKPVQEASHGS